MKSRVGAIIIKNKKILLVTGKGSNAYWTPGGKVEDSETQENALRREIKEEIGLEAKDIKKYHSYVAMDTIHNMRKEFTYYLVSCSGNISPANEITAAVWFSVNEIIKNKIICSPGTKEIIPRLVKDKLL